MRIPLLNFAGFSLISAFGMNLLALPFTTSMGAISQKQNIDFRFGSYMILGGSVGTVIGTIIAFSLSVSVFWLAVVFLFASLIAVLALKIKYITPTTSENLSPTMRNITFGTCVCNILIGMRGGSEGSLFVPLLTAMNVETHKAIATSLFAAVFTSTVGALLYWS
ncbi:MAG: sulfite exporter TauE/SafE family protein, partial [Candidatus Thorarchaeota archaeon]|nr:sulfite exporter TauE/SafE family protein [Candidatus Thorarchaeota archaeon]